MPDLTPPPMSDIDIRQMFLANGFTIKEGMTDLKPYVYEAARAIEAHINEQWRQRLEQFGWVIHQDGEPVDASCIWSQKPNEDELKFLANTLGPDASPLVVEPLYRIKEQE